MIPGPTGSSPAASVPGKADRARWVTSILNWSTQHPVWTLVLVSWLAVVINSYPVLFCGKSYVSPANVPSLVYDWWPPMPGMESPGTEMPQHGSDTGAMMWWDVPVGFIESNSLLKEGEIPLWNRYGHAGAPLLGQGVSLLGDPLQLIVIAGHGSALAWDAKFLTAKFIFCAGFGLLILRLMGSRPLSLIYSALGAYCGAYFLISNHPVFFVFSYSPWILLSAMGFLDLQSKRPVCWGLAWLVANFACFNGGHVEVSVDLIAGLNLAALVDALARQRGVFKWARLISRMGVATGFFLGLTAPVWISFLVALDGSYTAHGEIKVFQLPFKYLPGAFDDVFYPGITRALAPCTSLLVLAGCILSALNWRQLKQETFFWANVSFLVVWGGCVFGWVPASALATVPFLNQVGHTYTDLSFLLVIHLTIQSAYGFRCLARQDNFRQSVTHLVCVALVLAGMAVEYSYGIMFRPVPWNYVFCVSAAAIGAPLLFAFLKGRHHSIPALGWVGIIILGLAAQHRFGLYNAGNEDLMLVMGPRVTLNIPSKAIDHIKADQTDVFRIAPLKLDLSGDYSAVYGLEDIDSCAPVSSGEYIRLVQHFPGMKLSADWVIEVTNLVEAQPLLSLLNVKYVLANPTNGASIGPGFRVSERSDFLVFENPQMWPRAFFAEQVFAVASNEEFIRELSKKGRQPFIALTPAEIEKQPGLHLLENTTAPTITPAAHYQLRANSTAFDVHAASPGMVCLTEGQAKDFTATANEKAVTVLTVNRAFKGIYLDQPGDYHIVFTYRPRHWRLACTLFWISLAGVAGLAAAGGRCARRYEKIGQVPE